MKHADTRTTSPAWPRLGHNLLAVLASPAFFWVTIGLLIFQALWIALTARFPQAFDEQYHLAVIQYHAAQWWPLLTHQPAGADMYGPIAYDPSFLYHYLLSFPYRLLAHLVHSQTSQVVVLRCLNILFFAGGLVVFRRLLGRLPLSRAAVNVAIFFFVATPVVPLLAAQINYDTLLFVLTALALWLFTRLLEQFAARRVSALTVGWLLAVCLAASLTKYAFLPIFLAVAVVVLRKTVQAYGWGVWRRWPAALKDTGKRAQLTLIVGLVLIGGGLLCLTAGANLVRFHAVQPACEQVLSPARCAKNAIYIRNQNLISQKPPVSAGQIIGYPFSWVHRTLGELVFTISSAFGSDGQVRYFSAPPTPVINGLAYAVLAAGVILALRYGRRLWRQPVMRGLLAVAIFYTLVLFLQNFQDFLQYHDVVAVHGRYLLPVLLIFYAAICLMLRWTLADYARRVKAPALIITLVIVVLLTQGGGFLTFIVRSQPQWFWPQSSPAQTVNRAAQTVLKPFIIGA